MSKDALKVLEDLSKELRSLKDATITFPGLTSDNQDKAVNLQKSGRDFFEVNKTAENIFADGMQKEAESNPYDIKADDLLNAGAEAFHQLVVQRFESGGKDISLKPLKASTIKAKNSSKIGIDSGELLQNIKSAKPLVRKT